MIKKIVSSIFLILFLSTFIISQEIQNSSYYTLGSSLMHNNYYKEALKYFQLSIKYNEPKIKEATIEAGYCYKIMGNNKEAIKFGKKALQYELVNIERGRVYALIGESYGYLEDYKNAFYYFDLMQLATSIYDIPLEFKFIKEGWKYITQTDYDCIYYNMNSIKKNGKDRIKVWLKYYWDEKTVTEEDQKIISKNNNIIDAYNQRINEIMKSREYVSYILDYVEYDFIKNRNRVIETIKYDKNGNVLKSFSFQSSSSDKVDSNWRNIVPNSVAEKILDILRKKFNQ